MSAVILDSTGKPMEYRGRQAATVTQINQPGKKGVAGSSLVELSAPTGSGKSVLAAATVLHDRSTRGVIVTSQKYLQDQYATSFSNVAIVKGRDNYSCKLHNTTARACTYPKQKGNACTGCVYKKATQALSGAGYGSLLVVNTSLYLTTRMLHPTTFANVSTVVYDEAHLLEDSLLSAVTLELTLPSTAVTAGVHQGEELSSCHRYVEERVRDLQHDLKKARRGSPEHLRLSKQLGLWSHAQGVLRRAVYGKGRTHPWLVEFDETASEAVIRPLALYSSFGELLRTPEDGVPYRKVLVMSATPDPSLFSALNPSSKEANWGQPYVARRLAMTSGFPAKRRPVAFLSVGSMARGSKASTLPKLCKKIVELATKYKNVRMAVHTVSGALAKDIGKALKETEEGYRVVVHDGGDKKAAVDYHEMVVRHNSIILSPSLGEGYDGMDDKLRVNVIAKTPFPYLGDPWVRWQKDNRPKWYEAKASSGLVQMAGRAMRHKDDYGITYVLDSDAERLYSQHSGLFPDWFREGVDAGVKHGGAKIRVALV